MKKVMKKMLIAGMACVCGAALLAGCGGDSGSKSGGEKQFLNIATGGGARGDRRYRRYVLSAWRRSC
mgnify:CR=1 FL=1